MASNRNAFTEFWEERGTGEKVAIVWLGLVLFALIVLGIWLIVGPIPWLGWCIIGLLTLISVCLAIGYIAEENNW
ncbi:membrane protein [Arthrobacter phage Atuin]|nr:membrane protein [Arthrobacter phage Atuin]